MKFHDRDTRDRVATARRSLKGTGEFIADDLTSENADLLKNHAKNADVKKVWSWKGTVWAIWKDSDKPKKMDLSDAV